MVEGTLSGTANQKILNAIEGPDDVRALNWCVYINESLKEAKTVWSNRKKYGQFNGPITFLIVSWPCYNLCPRMCVTSKNYFIN